MRNKSNRHTAKAIEIRKRMHRIRRFLLEGTTDQDEIAAAIGCTQPTVSRYIRRIEDNWEKDSSSITRRERIKVSKKHEHLYNLSLVQFQRSCNCVEEVTTTTRMEPCPDCEDGMKDGVWCLNCEGEGEVKAEVVTRKVKGQAGDASLLGECRKNLSEIARLWHLVRNPKGGRPRKHVVEAQVLHAHVHQLGGNGSGKYDNVPIEMIIKAKEAIEEVRAAARGQGAIEVESSIIGEEKDDAG